MELLKTIKVETNCPTVWFNTLKSSNFLSAIQHEIDVLIDKLPTEKDKDNLYILLNEQGTK